MVNALGQASWLRLRTVGRPLGRAKLSRLSPILILAPHPDDETLGCGGLIATASELGLRPRVAYLTDGSASHPGSRAWPRRRLTAVRRAEALEALGALGVPPRDACFLDWPDGAPYAPGGRRYRQSLATLIGWIGRRRLNSVWAPWGGEDHCDHLAAANLARRLVLRMAAPVTVMSYLVWGWADPRLIRVARQSTVWTLRCPQTIARRRTALACHRTQVTGIIDDSERPFRIPPELAALTERPVEIYLRAA